jgi:hypothetical protein
MLSANPFLRWHQDAFSPEDPVEHLPHASFAFVMATGIRRGARTSVPRSPGTGVFCGGAFGLDAGSYRLGIGAMAIPFIDKARLVDRELAQRAQTP